MQGVITANGRHKVPFPELVVADKPDWRQQDARRAQGMAGMLAAQISAACAAASAGAPSSCSMLILMTAGCLPCHSQGPQLCLAANSLKFGNSLASELTCGRWPPGNLSAPFRDRATLHLVAIKSVTDAYRAWCDRDHGHWPIVHAEQICMKLKMHRVLLHLSEADAAGPGDIRISSVPSTQHQWLHQTAFKKRSHMGKHYCAAAVERRCIVS